ncbi:uncharacterized protein LOC109404927 [Aedes albopictus]|uniref:Secreted protein n=1 Tax=Aedes albopictus TaxID=7160 RepID=A0ABM1YWR4_AEDAL|nr:uncharacterized protein LOC109404927 [Aedes albopictus]
MFPPSSHDIELHLSHGVHSLNGQSPVRAEACARFRSSSSHVVMDVRAFRRIGFLYAVVCLLGSTVGAIYFFRKLVKDEPICVDYFCENETVNLLNIAINMMLCTVSITFSLFVKIGIDEAIPGYIQISRVFMLTRNIVLMIRWTYESVALTVCQINGDNDTSIVNAETTATMLLIAMSALCGLELWILDGVQRYVVQKAQEDRREEEVY